MDKTEEKALAGCAIIFSAMVLVPSLILYGIIAEAFVGTLLWDWFVVEYAGVPALTLPQAAGLSLVVSVFSPVRVQTTEAKENKFLWGSLVTIILRPWTLLLVGWVIHRFFM